MNEHFAKTMHQQKMANFYAEAQGSRLAAQSVRLGLRDRIRSALALVRRPNVVEQDSVQGHVYDRPSRSKVGVKAMREIRRATLIAAIAAFQRLALMPLAVALVIGLLGPSSVLAAATAPLAQKFHAAIVIGSNSCLGFNACLGAVGPIGDNSCVGYQACTGATGAIGNNSCNGPAIGSAKVYECMGAQGPIGNNSCNDNHACYLSEKAIGRYSCNGGGACMNTAIPIGDCQLNLVDPPECVGQPDGRIRLGTGAYVGNNVYNMTGLNQTKKGAKRRGSTMTFGISIQNDGVIADRLTVRATGMASSMYTVTYFRGTSNITTAVVAGTYTTPSLAPGAKFLITAKVKVKSSATKGSSTTRVVTINSLNGTNQDAVKFIGKRG